MVDGGDPSFGAAFVGSLLISVTFARGMVLAGASSVRGLLAPLTSADKALGFIVGRNGGGCADDEADDGDAAAAALAKALPKFPPVVPPKFPSVVPPKFPPVPTLASVDG